MESFTTQQAIQMRDLFLELAGAVVDYRIELAKQGKLSPKEVQDLKDLANKLNNASNDFNGLVGLLTMENLSGALRRVSGATGNMKEAIKRLQKTDKLIRLATSALSLGGAFLSANPVAIIAQVSSFVDAASAVSEA